MLRRILAVIGLLLLLAAAGLCADVASADLLGFEASRRTPLAGPDRDARLDPPVAEPRP